MKLRELIDTPMYNQLSAPQFKNLIKSGFIEAKILDETIGEIIKPKNVSCEFCDLSCSVTRCGERTLLACAWQHIFWNIIIYTSLLACKLKSKYRWIMHFWTYQSVLWSFRAGQDRKKPYRKGPKYGQSSSFKVWKVIFWEDLLTILNIHVIYSNIVMFLSVYDAQVENSIPLFRSIRSG